MHWFVCVPFGALSFIQGVSSLVAVPSPLRHVFHCPVCQWVVQVIVPGVRVEEAGCQGFAPCVPVCLAQFVRLAWPFVVVGSLRWYFSLFHSGDQAPAICRCDVGKSDHLQIGSALIQKGQVFVLHCGVVLTMTTLFSPGQCSISSFCVVIIDVLPFTLGSSPSFHIISIPP